MKPVAFVVLDTHDEDPLHRKVWKMATVVPDVPQKVCGILSVIHDPQLMHWLANAGPTNAMRQLNKDLVEKPVIEMAVRALVKRHHECLELASLTIDTSGFRGLDDKPRRSSARVLFLERYGMSRAYKRS
ncbi:hypothetical protein [Rhizobium leguminosarum]|uniref:hypothetical protein n=1 Tax=Rhizobium leguminosarum TaxID=384 RepID=UPI0013D9144C|nr:hypothetical protein [Rhizobium leguminosarum]NEK35616.1 hypothetical protein [Rhizobium leguminosarum]